jgi:hypothetical protein
MTHEEAIAVWLRRRCRLMVLLNVAGSVASLLLGLLALFITFWVIYVGLYIAVNWIIPHSHDTRWWLSAALLTTLFVICIFTDLRWLERDFLASAAADYDEFTFAVAQVLGYPGMGTSAMTWVRFVSYLVCTGPRLVMQSPRLARQAARQHTFDVAGCAAVLRFLSRKDQRVPYEDTDEVIPAGHEGKRVYRHLRSLQGVIFLKSDPPGLSLTSTFRNELRMMKPKKGGV